MLEFRPLSGRAAADKLVLLYEGDYRVSPFFVGVPNVSPKMARGASGARPGARISDPFSFAGLQPFTHRIIAESHNRIIDKLIHPGGGGAAAPPNPRDLFRARTTTTYLYNNLRARA